MPFTSGQNTCGVRNQKQFRCGLPRLGSGPGKGRIGLNQNTVLGHIARDFAQFSGVRKVSGMPESWITLPISSAGFGQPRPLEKQCIDGG